MRRTRASVVAALIAALSTAAVAQAAPPASPAQQLQANEAAARQDVVGHMHGVGLPSGMTSIHTEPSFAKSFATGTPGKYGAVDQTLWSTTANPQGVIAYVSAHPPAGSMADTGTGTGSNSATGVKSVDVQFSWPDVSHKLFNRTLTLTVVTPPHGRSVVVAQTESFWFVPRSAAEFVPSGVHAVRITLRLGPPATGPVVKPGGHVKTSTYLVWRASRVRQLVDTFNGLPIVQPGEAPIACPMMLTGSGASALTLAFMTGRSGKTLAHAQVSVRRGTSSDDGAGPCDPIDFWIGSQQQTSLTSPTFVKAVGRLIGASIS